MSGISSAFATTETQRTWGESISETAHFGWEKIKNAASFVWDKLAQIGQYVGQSMKNGFNWSKENISQFCKTNPGAAGAIAGVIGTVVVYKAATYAYNYFKADNNANNNATANA